jgi:hypothetical protein
MPFKVNIDAGDLARALKAVIPHAEGRKTQQLNHTVHFEAIHGSLVLVATDSYTLAAAWVPKATADMFDLTLSLEDAKTLEKMARGWHNIHSVEIIVEGAKVTFRKFDFEWETKNLAASFEWLPWRVYVAEAVEGGGYGEGYVVYHGEWLARFKTAVTKAQPRLVMWPGNYPKATVVMGENFVGLIMSSYGSVPVRPAWIPGVADTESTFVIEGEVVA